MHGAVVPECEPLRRVAATVTSSMLPIALVAPLSAAPRTLSAPLPLPRSTTVTRRLDALPALQCPPGLEPASPLRLEDTIAPFVQDYVFANEEVKGFQSLRLRLARAQFDGLLANADRRGIAPAKGLPPSGCGRHHRR